MLGSRKLTFFAVAMLGLALEGLGGAAPAAGSIAADFAYDSGMLKLTLPTGRTLIIAGAAATEAESTARRIGGGRVRRRGISESEAESRRRCIIWRRNTNPKIAYF
jgi:hypothetical protein